MIPIGVYVKPSKPCKKMHIKVIEMNTKEFKLFKPRVSKKKKMKIIDKDKNIIKNKTKKYKS